MPWRPVAADPPPCGLALLTALFIAVGTAPAPGPAQAWKACLFNDQPLPCRDSHARDGTVRILWQDGLSMTYAVVKEGFPRSILRDRLGGLWEREVLVQGNAVFTHTANGNRIVVPLR
jgi:hypothetical protein